MKKALFTLTVAAIASTSFGQSFGVQVGGNLASTSAKYSGVTVSTGSKFGFTAGVVAELPIAEALSFRPELNFIQKGGKVTVPNVSENKTTLNYVELPLNVVYNSEAGSGSFFFGAGPVIGLGLSGKDKSKDLEDGSESSTDIKFDGKKEDDVTDDKEHLKSIDFGIDILAGYKFENGFFANVGYNLGLSNINPNDGASVKNKGLFIKVGYFFSQGSTKKAKK